MTDLKSSFEIHFPNPEPAPQGATLVVRDLDVVGVGALRRQQLRELQQHHSFVLRTFASRVPNSVHAIYEAELLETLKWLRPLRVEVGGDLDWLEEQKKVFPRLFPQTSSLLGMAGSRVRDLYLQEMEWSSWLLQDHWRYFPGFLRQKFPDNKKLQDLVHWEWVHAWIEVQPFDFTGAEKNLVTENPSLQTVALREDNELLGRDQGLYAFVYNEARRTVTERPLDRYDAAILDSLREDRKYSREQLLASLSLDTHLGPPLSPDQWQKRFLSLCEDGILLYEEGR